MATINNNRKQELNAPQELPLNQDIWVNHVLPFVGMGHFAFVAPASHQMKDMYLAYCDTVKNPPFVYERFQRRAFGTDTFYQSAVFSSVACAEHWLGCISLVSPHVHNYATSWIARTGNLQLFQWAHQKQFPMNGIHQYRQSVCEEAARHGHLLILKFAHENGCAWYQDTCAAAALGGSLDCLQYAHENGCPWNDETCSGAAWHGQLECLRYSHENGCPWNEETCSFSAKHGHLECLKFAHENGCPWNKDTCSVSAEHGHLECLKYAHENGCPWNEATCTWAAATGHLECLQYAHENGCPWNEWTHQWAAQNRNKECLQYLLESGCPLHAEAVA